MKKLVTFILLAVAFSCFAPPCAQAWGDSNSQVRKATKRQQKAIKKYAKAQRKSQRRMLKLDQKNNRRLNRPTSR
jgi:hypothetical protein